jgi:hypothetical protein
VHQVGHWLRLTTITTSTTIAVSAIKCYCKPYCFTLRSQIRGRGFDSAWDRGSSLPSCPDRFVRRYQPPIQRVLYGGITRELSSRNVTLTIKLYTVQEVKSKPTVPNKCQGSSWRDVLPTFTFKGKGRHRTRHGDPERYIVLFPQPGC